MQNSNFDIPNFDAPPTTSGLSSFSNDRAKRWDSDIQWFEWKPGWNTIRLFGPHTMAFIHWVNTTSNKMLPVLCRNFDIAKGERKPNGECDCPICQKLLPQVSTMYQDKNRWNMLAPAGKDRLFRMFPKKVIYTHLIDRASRDPKSWFPIKLTYSVASQIGRLKELNKIMYQGKEYMCDIDDVNYGKDVYVGYEPTNPDPGKRYQVVPHESKPLTEVERSFFKDIYNFKQLIEVQSADEIEKILVQQKLYDTLLTVTNEYNGGGQQSQPPQQPQQPQPQWSQPVAPSQPAWAQSQPPPQQGGFSSAIGQGESFPASQTPFSQPPMMTPPPFGQSAMTPPPFGQPVPPPPFSQPAMTPPPFSQPVPPPFVQPQEDVPHFPLSTTAAPVQGQTYSVQGKPVSKDDFQKVIADFAKSVVGGTKVWDGADDLKGFEVASCYGSYAGNSTCIRCPARKHCLIIGSDK